MFLNDSWRHVAFACQSHDDFFTFLWSITVFIPQAVLLKVTMSIESTSMWSLPKNPLNNSGSGVSKHFSSWLSLWTCVCWQVAAHYSFHEVAFTSVLLVVDPSSGRNNSLLIKCSFSTTHCALLLAMDSSLLCTKWPTGLFLSTFLNIIFCCELWVSSMALVSGVIQGVQAAVTCYFPCQFSSCMWHFAKALEHSPSNKFSCQCLTNVWLKCFIIDDVLHCVRILMRPFIASMGFVNRALLYFLKKSISKKTIMAQSHWWIIFDFVLYFIF